MFRLCLFSVMLFCLCFVTLNLYFDSFKTSNNTIRHFKKSTKAFIKLKKHNYLYSTHDIIISQGVNISIMIHVATITVLDDNTVNILTPGKTCKQNKSWIIHWKIANFLTVHFISMAGGTQHSHITLIMR